MTSRTTMGALVSEETAPQESANFRSMLLEYAFEASTEGVLITDSNASVIEANLAFVQMMGYSRTDLIGQNPRLLSSGHHEPAFYRLMWQTLLEFGVWRGEIWNRRKNGEIFVSRVTIKAVQQGPGPTYYIGFFSDITEPRREQERIEALAYYDPLTGLPNRVLYADRAQRALLAAQRKNEMVAVCCLDLNGFKPVNDRYGHRAGDDVLRAVAARLQAATRAEDTVARLGGDEFALLLSGIHSAKEAEILLERVLQTVSRPCTLSGGQTISVTASAGIALYPSVGRDLDTLLLRADEAMYAAKRDLTASYVLARIS